MPVVFKIVFLLFSFVLLPVGALKLDVPMRYPRLYERFLREAVMRRQHADRDRSLAIRTHGLIALTCGAFFALFVWALQ